MTAIDVPDGARSMDARKMGFDGDGVAQGDSLVEETGFRTRRMTENGVGLVVRVTSMTYEGADVRTLRNVLGLGLMVVAFCGADVAVVVTRSNVLITDTENEKGMDGMVGGEAGDVEDGVNGLVVGVVGFLVLVAGDGSIVILVRMNAKGGTPRLGVNVRRVGVAGEDVVLGLMEVQEDLATPKETAILEEGAGTKVVNDELRRVVQDEVEAGHGIERQTVLLRSFREAGALKKARDVGSLSSGGKGMALTDEVTLRVALLEEAEAGVAKGEEAVEEERGVGLRAQVTVAQAEVDITQEPVVEGVQ